MGQDLLIGDFAVDRLFIRIYQNRWWSDHVTACPTRIHLLNGMADRASNAIIIEVANNARAVGESPGYECDGIMTAFTMAGVRNALAIFEHIGVLDVPRCTERVCMR